MSVEEKLRVLSDRIKTHSSAMLTEEALKTAIVLPFLSALDYDVFNPAEVIPEYCADAVVARSIDASNKVILYFIKSLSVA